MNGSGSGRCCRALDQQPLFWDTANSCSCRRVACSGRGGNNVMSIWTHFACLCGATIHGLTGDGIDHLTVRSHELRARRGDA